MGQREKGPVITVGSKKYVKVSVTDTRTFEACQGKEVEEWSWKQAKNIKYVVHVDNFGKIDKKKNILNNFRFFQIF